MIRSRCPVAAANASSVKSMGLRYAVPRQKSLKASGSHLASRSRRVMKLPRLLAIFWPSIWTRPLCTQYLTKGFPVAPSLWAISFSWCGKLSSIAPPWMSIVSPRYCMAMAEHSMCQPG